MKTTTTKPKTTRRTTGLNGAVPTQKLTAKQKKQVEALHELQEMLSPLYKKGVIKVYDPIR